MEAVSPRQTGRHVSRGRSTRTFRSDCSSIMKSFYFAVSIFSLIYIFFILGCVSLVFPVRYAEAHFVN
jgi:hypothetical protein